MDLRGRKTINKAVFMWAVAALLLLIMATPALSTYFAAPGSVNTEAIVIGAVKTKRIANGAVNSAKIKDGSIRNADVAAGAAIGAAKINRTGLNADLLDGKDSGDFVAKASPTWATQTKHLSISTGAWVANNEPNNVARDPRVYSIGGGSLLAPVNLPDGAKVTQIDLYFDDSDGTNFSIMFLSWDLSTWDWADEGGGSISSSGASGRGHAVKVVAPPSTINNATKNYMLKAWNTSATKLIEGVVITYTTNQP